MLLQRTPFLLHVEGLVKTKMLSPKFTILKKMTLALGTSFGSRQLSSVIFIAFLIKKIFSKILSFTLKVFYLQLL